MMNSDAIAKILNVAQKELGTVEQPKDSNRTKYGKWYGMDGSPWCFDGSVELLTENGWIPFKEYDGTYRVAQVDQKTQEIELVSPIRLIQKTYTGRGVQVQRRGINLICDEGHRFWGNWKRLDRMGVKTEPRLEFFPVKDLLDRRSSVLSIPSSNGTKKTDPYPITDKELILLAAFLTDGCFHRGRIDIQVSRQSKIEWFSQLNPLNVYTAPRAYGISKKPLTTFTFEIPDVFDNFFDDYKELKISELYKFTWDQAQLLLSWVTKIDGTKQSKNGYTLTQSRKQIIDAMQVLCLLSGHQSSVSVDKYRGGFCSDKEKFTYRLNFYEGIQKPTTIKSSQAKEILLDNYELYCVEVPSNLIIVRSANGGIPIVVGNCAMFTSWVFHQAGYPLPVMQDRAPSGAAYCPFIEQYARRNGVWHSSPRVGDLALFHFGKREAIHIGIVEKIIDSRNFICIEGNTSVASNDNGGAVMRRHRSVSQCRGFARFPLAGAKKGKDAYYRLIRLTDPFMEGNDIEEWQKQVNYFQYGLKVDGVYGPKSEKVCIDLQKKRDIEVDGVIGPDTWRESWERD